MTSLLSLAWIRITVLMWRCWKWIEDLSVYFLINRAFNVYPKIVSVPVGVSALSVPYSNSYVDILEICVFRHVPILIIHWNKHTQMGRNIYIDGQRPPFGWNTNICSYICNTCYTYECIRVLILIRVFFF